jgi:hypothetical protein
VDKQHDSAEDAEGEHRAALDVVRRQHTDPTWGTTQQYGQSHRHTVEVLPKANNGYFDRADRGCLAQAETRSFEEIVNTFRGRVMCYLTSYISVKCPIWRNNLRMHLKTLSTRPKIETFNFRIQVYTAARAPTCLVVYSLLSPLQAQNNIKTRKNTNFVKTDIPRRWNKNSKKIMCKNSCWYSQIYPVFVVSYFLL